jgi:hypothetical protein
VSQSPPLARILTEAQSNTREHVEKVLQSQLDQLSSAIEQEFEGALREGSLRARREFTGTLNQTVRRLRDAESSAEWCRALLDATSEFCERAALFSVLSGRLKVLGARNLPLQSIDLPLSSAPAFVQVSESKEPVIAVRSPKELSQELLSALGDSGARRVHLFPISNGRVVSVVLHAEDAGTPIDATGLEMLSGIAGLTMEHRIAARSSAAPGLVRLESAGSDRCVVREWSELTREEQETHLRAQRFARVKIANIRLYRSDEVKTARAERNLYAQFREEIDSARQEFDREFIAATPTMLDYLHLELVGTLANDDAAALGSDYPGGLV